MIVLMLNRKYLTVNPELLLTWRGSKVVRLLPKSLDALLVMYWFQIQAMTLDVIRTHKS